MLAIPLQRKVHDGLDFSRLRSCGPGTALSSLTITEVTWGCTLSRTVNGFPEADGPFLSSPETLLC